MRGVPVKAVHGNPNGMRGKGVTLRTCLLYTSYKLIKTGDFFVTDYVGHSNTVVVDRDGAAIINVVFKSEGGKNLGGGDYFVDEDGDGVANFSELPLPEGYELIQTGDFFVSDYAGQSNVIVLHKS